MWDREIAKIFLKPKLSMLEVIGGRHLHLLPPFRRFLRFSPSLIELTDPLSPVIDGNPAFPGNRRFLL